MRGNSAARIGFIPDSDTTVQTNTISSNPQGIIVSANSSARIAGNTIASNTGNGILVERASQSDIAGNLINSNSLSAIAVSQNSGANLADGSAPIFDLFNTTTSKNSGAAVACTMGGYVSGYLGSLAGSKNIFDATCIKALQSAPTLIGTWNVTASSNLNNPPTQLSFLSGGTGTTTTGGQTSTMRWTLGGNLLTLKPASGNESVGPLSWSGSNDVTYSFAPTDHSGKESAALAASLTLQRASW